MFAFRLSHLEPVYSFFQSTDINLFLTENQDHKWSFLVNWACYESLSNVLYKSLGTLHVLLFVTIFL